MHLPGALDGWALSAVFHLMAHAVPWVTATVPSLCTSLPRRSRDSRDTLLANGARGSHFAVARGPWHTWVGDRGEEGLNSDALCKSCHNTTTKNITKCTSNVQVSSRSLVFKSGCEASKVQWRIDFSGIPAAGWKHRAKYATSLQSSRGFLFYDEYLNNLLSASRRWKTIF